MSMVSLKMFSNFILKGWHLATKKFCTVSLHTVYGLRAQNKISYKNKKSFSFLITLTTVEELKIFWIVFQTICRMLWEKGSWGKKIIFSSWWKIRAQKLNVPLLSLAIIKLLKLFFNAPSKILQTTIHLNLSFLGSKL